MTQQKPHNLKVPVFIAALMALIAHSSLAAGPCKHFAAERQPFFWRPTHPYPVFLRRIPVEPKK